MISNFCSFLFTPSTFWEYYFKKGVVFHLSQQKLYKGDYGDYGYIHLAKGKVLPSLSVWLS